MLMSHKQDIYYKQNMNMILYKITTNSRQVEGNTSPYVTVENLSQVDI